MSKAAGEPNADGETLFLIYRDVAQFLTKKQQTDLAIKWYSRSLELNPENAECYYSRSVNSANSGYGLKSLEDAQTALKLLPRSTQINLQEASAYVHCNEFEEALKSLHNSKKKFSSKNMKAFNKELEAIEGIYANCLGFELGHFSCCEKKLFKETGERIRAEKLVEDKHLWKKLQEQHECDVVSIPEIKKEFVHPREIERRKLAYKKFHQIYAGRSWIDLIFLNKLRNDKILLLPQTKYSTQQIKTHLNENFNTSKAFFKMLHAQDPLYHTKLKQCPNPAVAEHRLQSNLYGIQYQTRKEMFFILNHVKTLRKAKQVKELVEYVERVMCIFPAIKIKRVMPWKYQFMYEIYNAVGLAYCDEFVTLSSKNIQNFSVYEEFLSLLQVEKPKDKQNISYVFGDKATFQEPDAKDYGFIRYTNHIKKLEKWLLIAAYPIESIFVLYQISLAHLMRGKYKDCLLFITRCKTLCDKYDNDLWKFLSNLMMVKAYALQERIEKNSIQIQLTIKSAAPLQNSTINLILSNVSLLNAKLLKLNNIKPK